MISLVTMLLALWLSSWYQTHFPQNVKSNYSVGSYTDSGLSWEAVTKAFVYLVVYHQSGTAFGPAASRWLISFILSNGIGSLGLWWFRRKVDPRIASYYGMAFLLWASAIIWIVIVSQSAHVQIVPNYIRGRYFTLAYFACAFSLALTAATAWADISGSWIEWRQGSKYWIAGLISIILATWMIHIASWGWPTLQIVSTDKSNLDIASEIRAARLPAVLGNYWWVWPIQYEINSATGGKPIVTPVSVRTESFNLNAFYPILQALQSTKSFRFVCVEMKDPPPELSESCGQQIAFFRSQGGLPNGELAQLGHSEIGRYKLTYYELGLAHPGDASDCSTSEVTLRAARESEPEQDSYLLTEEGFVYLQRPVMGDHWELEFTDDTGEKALRVPRNVQGRLHLLNHQVEIFARECRIMVSVEHNERLYPHTMRLVIR